VCIPQARFVPRGPVYYDQADKLRQETRNGVIQAEFIFHKASNNARDPVGPELLLELQRLAVNQIYRCAGHFRDGPVILEGAEHKPPDHTEVIALVGEMCEYINAHWQAGDPATRLSAYAMWRLNWIHPFFGGNGRTARAFSYLVLCLRLGFAPPTEEKNIPELIVADRDPYYAALRSADAAWKTGTLDISAMEAMISALLAKQLASIHFRATGKQMPF
jgi:Fic family protein